MSPIQSDSPTQTQRRLHKPACGVNTLTFPFQSFNLTESYKRHSPHQNPISLWLSNQFKVHAAEVEKVAVAKDSHNTDKQHHPRLEPPHADTANGVAGESPVYSRELEMLARAYIQQETGAERVRMIFKKDHIGGSSPEMEYIQVALVQTFVLSFFMKYVPEWRVAKNDFIREHHGTIFRTRLEALRQMQDSISLRAGWEGGKFGIKMTAFSASFLFLSQMIASYRNKTSVLEYTVAAGITGGLSRLQLGIKGFISGSVIGSILGSLVGCLAYGIFTMRKATQEERHVYAVMSLLDVEKSVEGDSEFKRKLEQVKQQQLGQALPAS